MSALPKKRVSTCNISSTIANSNLSAADGNRVFKSFALVSDLTAARTVWPRSRRVLTTHRPMYPLGPVTRTLEVGEERVGITWTIGGEGVAGRASQEVEQDENDLECAIIFTAFLSSNPKHYGPRSMCKPHSRIGDRG